MRIVVASSFHYFRGGDSAQFLALVDELERQGHEVALFAMHHPQNLPSPWSRYWVPYFEYRGHLTSKDRLKAAWRSIYSSESGRQMARLLGDFKPDVVHFHSVQHQLTLAAVEASLSAGIPIVWTLHDYRTVCPASALLRGDEVCERCAGGRFWHGVAGRCKSGDLSRSLAAVAESYATRLRGALAKVDCYVAPSEFLARKVIEMGLPARRMEVVPNGVREAPPQACTSQRRGLLYVGRLSVEKGVDFLVTAAAGLAEAPLCIVGDGPDADRLRRLAESLSADVRFDGWTDADGVRERMAAAELLCVPSVWYENCPGVVLEAMAVGLPVVASDLGGLTELLDGGRAGWLAPAGDPEAWERVLRQALRDRERTAGKAAHASARVRARHDPQGFIERIQDIYGSVAR
jgi:glycosyltransferase involved in cell wall biosynthesis